ncbi:MAG: PAS domain-containing protein [Candidatus Zixiibacteriota bacterium]
MGISRISRKDLYYLYVKIALASMIIAYLTAYGLQIGKRQGYNYMPLINASMEIKLEVTNVRLWFEEILREDSNENVDFVWASLAKADRYVKALQEGGENIEGKVIHGDKDVLKTDFAVIRKKLEKFKQISKERYFNRAASEPGSLIDRQFDQVFLEIMAVTDRIKTGLQSLYQKDLVTFRIIQAALMISSVLLAIWVAYILYRYESAKRRDFDALDIARDSLSRELSCRKNIEIALRESETRYRNLIENADDVIYTLSAEGIILSLNLAFERITGWNCNEWVNKRFDKLIHPEDLEFAGKMLIETFEGKKIPTYELRILTKNKNYLTGEFRVSLITDNNGQVIILGIARDISKRKEMQTALNQTENEYQTLVKNLPIGAFRSTTSGEVLSANPALAKMLGYDSPEEYEAIPAQKSYLNPKRREEFVKLLRENGKVDNFVSQMIRKDGTVIWVSSSVHGVHDEDGKTIYFDGIEKDITEQKIIETERNTLFDISRLYLTSDKSETFYNEIAKLLTARLQYPISFIELWNEKKGEMTIMGPRDLSWKTRVQCNSRLKNLYREK